MRAKFEEIRFILANFMSRLRNIPNAIDKIKKSKLVLDSNKKINIRKIFKNNNPLIVDLGCGKGDFIIKNAINYPKNNYLGIEKNPTIVLKILNKINNLDKVPDNLYFICASAENLLKIIKPKSLETLFLNFSDPWPKKRHFKRRLTYKSFLNIYYKILKSNGKLIIKTDNLNLYEFSLEELKKFKKLKLIFYSSDIYKNKKIDIEKEIISEYEKKFYLQKKPVNKIIVQKI